MRITLVITPFRWSLIPFRFALLEPAVTWNFLCFAVTYEPKVEKQ